MLPFREEGMRSQLHNNPIHIHIKCLSTPGPYRKEGNKVTINMLGGIFDVL